MRHRFIVFFFVPSKGDEMRKRKIFTALCLVVILLTVMVGIALAQSTTTLDITTDNITPNLFLGANIMITALLGVMMLVAGLAFGMGILTRLVNAIKSGVGR
jgi:hypothetical protein